MKRLLILVLLLLCSVGWAKPFSSKAQWGGGFKSGFMPGQQVTVNQAVLSMPIADYIGIWDAVYYSNGGVGAVATLSDSSVAGHHLTCSVETQKPTKGIDAFGTYLQTDGGDGLGYQSAGIPCSSSISMVAVFLPASSAKAGVICSLADGVYHRDAYFSQTDNNKPGWTDQGNYYFGQDSSYSITEPTIVSYLWDGAASLTCRINGAYAWTDTSASIRAFTTNPIRLAILCEAFPWPGSASYGYKSGGKFYFWAVWNQCDQAKIIQAEQYLANRYGVTLQ